MWVCSMLKEKKKKEERQTRGRNCLVPIAKYCIRLSRDAQGQSEFVSYGRHEHLLSHRLGEVYYVCAKILI